MQNLLGEINMLDFSTGLILSSQVNDPIFPNNAVTEAINVDFFKVGSVTVRKGITKLSTTVLGSTNVDGLTVFTSNSATLNYPVVAVGSARYYFSGSGWNTISGSFTPGSKARFVTFGNRLFTVNGTESMKSWDGSGSWEATNCVTGITPKFIESFKSRIYVAGDATEPDKLFFSTVISSGSVSWTTGTNFVNVNPSDNAGNITALKKCSAYLLIFKNYAMYRWDGSATQPDLLVDIGTPSQESVQLVKGICYFFSPYGIFRTDGGYPEWISKPVQDFIDAVPLANWAKTAAYSDDKYYECFIGDVTVSGVSYTNVSLRIDTTNQTWTVRSYAKTFRAFDRFYSSTYGAINIGGSSDGSVYLMNNGNSDDGAVINYSIITHVVDFGRMGSNKVITDKVFIFTDKGAGSFFEAILDEQTRVPLGGSIVGQVHKISPVNLKAKQFRFKWYGQTSTCQPNLNGFTFTDVKDEGYQ